LKKPFNKTFTLCAFFHHCLWRATN